MKKKFLSLMMAAAMVATTSVSAFASEAEQQTQTPQISQTPSEASNPREYNVTDTEVDAEVTIDGKIANSLNKLPTSTISVSVPTAASFTVDKDGNLVGSDIKITSQGSEEIAVLAHKFVDKTGDKQINVVDTEALKLDNAKDNNADRKKVSLTLEGNERAVSLITAPENKSGICKFDTSEEAQEQDKRIGTVSVNKPLKLKLRGKGITAVNAQTLSDPISDSFTLTLKLKKVNANG